MTTITKGYTFGSTELVTNTKMHTLVDSATAKVWGIGSFPTNASLPDFSTGTLFKCYYSTYGSIATMVNATLGVPYTLVAQQASFPCILDSGSFKLSADWKPATANSSLTLIWDGTNYIEVARVSA